MGTGSEKIRTVLGLVMVILLVFITNQLDKKHFEEVQESIVSIHYDRVVAQDHIFRLSQNLQEMRLRLKNGEQVNFDQNGEIEQLVAEYEETKLTKKEGELLGRLKNDFDRLGAADMSENGSQTFAVFDQMNLTLNALSEIQVKESKSLQVRAQDSLDSNALMSNLEMGLIIIFGVVLQFVLFWGGKRKIQK